MHGLVEEVVERLSRKQFSLPRVPPEMVAQVARVVVGHLPVICYHSGKLWVLQEKTFQGANEFLLPETGVLHCIVDVTAEPERRGDLRGKHQRTRVSHIYSTVDKG